MKNVDDPTKKRKKLINNCSKQSNVKIEEMFVVKPEKIISKSQFILIKSQSIQLQLNLFNSTSRKTQTNIYFTYTSFFSFHNQMIIFHCHCN